MKKIMIIASFLFFAQTAMVAQRPLETLKETEPVFSFCEAFAPSKDSSFLYVTNVVGGAMDRDGKAFISTMDLQGNIIEKEWFNEGMNAPKDVFRFENRLYVADLNEIIVIDIDRRTVIERIVFENAGMIHNLTVASDGAIYGADMFSGRIYKVVDGKKEVFVEGLNYAAGMLVDDGKLFVVSSGGMSFGAPGQPMAENGRLVAIDLSTKEVSTVAQGFNPMGNGLVRMSGGDFVVSCWSGVMYRVDINGEVTLLRDTRQNPHIACGMMWYDSRNAHLYMTTDESNYIVIFSLL